MLWTMVYGTLWRGFARARAANVAANTFMGNNDVVLPANPLQRNEQLQLLKEVPPFVKEVPMQPLKQINVQ